MNISPSRLVYKTQPREAAPPGGGGGCLRPHVRLLSEGDAGRSHGAEDQQQSLCSSHELGPPTSLIWPTPAPNPIIKPACLNISHWHGPFQLLRVVTGSRLCASGRPTAVGPFRCKLLVLCFAETDRTPAECCMSPSRPASTDKGN